MRGEPINMSALAAKHADQPALGNAQMNARGDILGKGGVVLKTQEQIEAEWAAEKARQQLTAGQSADIKAPLNVIVAGLPQPTKMVEADDADFDPNTAVIPTDTTPKPTTPPASRRKIVDAD